MVKLDIYINLKNEDRLEKIVKIFQGHSSNGNIINANMYSLQEQKYESKYDPEYSFVQKSINNTNPDSYLIVCQDCITTTALPNTIYDVIDKVIETQPDFDLFYLANYKDQCELMTEAYYDDETGLNIVNSKSPNPGSILCVLFSPSGKKKFNTVFGNEPVLKPTLTNKKVFGNYLNMKIKNGEFNAVTTSTPLISFDILVRKNDKDLEKSILCAEPIRNDVPPNTDISNPEPEINDTTTSLFSNYFGLDILKPLIDSDNTGQTTGQSSNVPQNRAIDVLDDDSWWASEMFWWSLFWFFIIILIIIIITAILIYYTGVKADNSTATKTT